MKNTRLANLLLFLIALALFSLAARPYLAPPTAHAQSTSPYPFYIEPGTQMLRAPGGSRQVLGRVMIDMRTGDVWGFPTTTTDTYPVNVTNSQPQTSHPFLLGKFAFADVEKR